MFYMSLTQRLLLACLAAGCIGLVALWAAA